MLDLSEEIRTHVDAACPPVALDEVRALIASSAAIPSTKRSYRAVWMVAACMALVILISAVVVQILPSGEPTQSAAAALGEVARVAASRPSGSTPGKQQYLFYEYSTAVAAGDSTIPGSKSFPLVSVERVQTWIAPDGSGRQKITWSKPSLLLSSQAKSWKAAGSPSRQFENSDRTFPDASSGRFGPPGGPFVSPAGGPWRLSYPDTATFPRQPAALERAIEGYYGVTGGPYTVFALSGDALQVGASPTLRAALFHLVQQLPGVTVLGKTKDEAGRTGIGVSMTSASVRAVLIFNPRTSAVLGEKFIQTRASTIGGDTVIPKGTVIGFKTFGATGITNSVDKLPNGSSVEP